MSINEQEMHKVSNSGLPLKSTLYAIKAVSEYTYSRSLNLVDDSFRKIMVVGEHTKPWSDDDGIQIISVFDFLLDTSFTE